MAAGDAEVSQSLKKALIESLTAILSPQQEIRIHGEEQIKLLEVTEGKLIVVIHHCTSSHAMTCNL